MLQCYKQSNKAQRLQHGKVAVDVVSQALSTSSGGTTGRVVSALSPAGAYAIGQYFKNNDSLNRQDGGNRAGEGSKSHLLAHGLLAFATSYATGQSPETITATTLSTMGAEKLAPALGKLLYDTDKIADLTAEQKQTISNVLGTAGLVAGVVTAQATGADSISSVSAGQQVQGSVQNAVENNYLNHPEKVQWANEKKSCIASGKSPAECSYIDKKWLEISRKKNDELTIICKTYTAECQRKHEEYNTHLNTNIIKYSDELGEFSSLPADPSLIWASAALLKHNRQAEQIFRRAKAQNGTAWDKAVAESLNAYQNQRTVDLGDFNANPTLKQNSNAVYAKKKDNCCELANKTAVSETKSGVINPTKLRNGSIDLGLTPTTKKQVDDIVKHGDHRGHKTETLFENVVKEHGGKVLSGGKYGSNNGYDHVVVFKDTDGKIYLTMTVDSKQLTQRGVKLDPKAAGGTMQMSDAWDRAVLPKLDPNSPARQAIETAKRNGNLVKAVAYVDKQTGQLKLVRIDPKTPPKSTAPKPKKPK